MAVFFNFEALFSGVLCSLMLLIVCYSSSNVILASAVSLYPSADSAGNKSSFSIVLGSGSSVCISIETVLAGLVFSCVVCVSCSVIFICLGFYDISLYALAIFGLFFLDLMRCLLRFFSYSDLRFHLRLF